MKNILYFLSFITLFITLFIIACDTDPDIKDGGDDPTQDNFRGAWIVNASITGDDFTYGPFVIKTQTANDKDSLSIIDDDGLWDFQVKAAINMESNSFASQSSVNTKSTVGAKSKVLNGIIVGSDSISFSIQFEDDETPYGYTYNIKGKRQ